MNKIRTGVVGFGKMGLLHGASASINEEMSLVAVCEKNAFMKSAFKSVLKGVNFYSDYEKMIEKEQLDAIVITTPTFNHFEVAKKAMEKGMAVFCEKPLAVNGDEAAELAKIAKTNKIPTIVGFSNRFFPTIGEGKKIIDNGRIGDVLEVKAEMYIGDVFKENNGWRYSVKTAGGGALIDFGIHMIDLLVWYFGDIKSVEAETRKLYSKEVEDEASAKLYFSNGLCAQYETSWSRMEYRKSSPIITIIGTDGKMVVTEQTIDIDFKNGEMEAYTYPDLYKGDFADIAGINYSLEMKEFIDTIKGKSTDISMEQGAKIQKIIDAMYKSAEKKCRVEVEE